VAVDQVAPMLMFLGQAEEAIGFYTGLFDDSAVEFIQRYGPGFPGPEDQVVHSRFRLKGQLMLAMDSNVPQPFTFTPSISFYVTCADEAEIDRLYAGLVAGGSVMMDLDAYPFAKKYAWVQDRFGVSWQLVLSLQ
jgi:predicted 3-demethylubiquinone-9 3-methyltransferase (glyoxalase superfamily)